MLEGTSGPKMLMPELQNMNIQVGTYIRGSYGILRLGGGFQSLALTWRVQVCFSMSLLGGSEGMPPKKLFDKYML